MTQNDRGASSVETVVLQKNGKDIERGESSDDLTPLLSDRNGDSSDASHLTPARNGSVHDPGDSPVSTPSPGFDEDDPRLVYTTLTMLEWLGRHNSLHDRYRNETRPGRRDSRNSLINPSASAESSNNSTADGQAHDEARLKARVYRQLEAYCKTVEARESLAEFQNMMVERERQKTAGPRGKKVRERHGFFQSLIGKKK
ncbi:hypothetical protein ACLMJK_004522 [Lecanora helva]